MRIHADVHDSQTSTNPDPIWPKPTGEGHISVLQTIMIQYYYLKIIASKYGIVSSFQYFHLLIHLRVIWISILCMIVFGNIPYDFANGHAYHKITNYKPVLIWFKFNIFCKTKPIRPVNTETYGILGWYICCAAEIEAFINAL